MEAHAPLTAVLNRQQAASVRIEQRMRLTP